MRDPEHAVTNLFDPDLDETEEGRRELARRGAELHRRIGDDLERDARVMSTGEVNEHERAMRSLEREFRDEPHFKQLREDMRQEKAAATRAAKREEEQPDTGDREDRGPKRPRPRPPRPGGRRRAFAAGLLTGRAHPLAESTGLPSTSRGIAGNVLYAVGGIVGLAIVYDVLVSTEHAGAAPLLFIRGLTGFLNRLVAPVDPLAPIGSLGHKPLFGAAGGAPIANYRGYSGDPFTVGAASARRLRDAHAPITRGFARLPSKTRQHVATTHSRP